VEEEVPVKPVPVKTAPVPGGSRLEKKPVTVPAAVNAPVAAALPDSDEEGDSISGQLDRRRQFSLSENKKDPVLTNKKVGFDTTFILIFMYFLATSDFAIRESGIRFWKGKIILILVQNNIILDIFSGFSIFDLLVLKKFVFVMRKLSLSYRPQCVPVSQNLSF